ncbi:MAG TPA: hypothetical protein PK675_01565 [Clostridia bacterium]|nr:hypothetical protein [Clostridia bacterium]
MEQLKFKIKLSFWLASAAVLLLGKLSVFAFYLVSVLIHELSHYFVALKYFYKCERIEISAFGLTLYGDFEEAVSKEQTNIALAGPLANIIIAVILFAAWYIYPEIYVFTRDFLYANLSIGLINLLPCYPLDGGKALLGILTKKKSYSASLKIVKTLTAVFSLTLFMIFVISLFTRYPLFALGIFAALLFSALLEQTDKKIYSRLNAIFGKKKRLKYGLEKKRLIFMSDTPLKTILGKIENGYVFEFEIVDENMKAIAVFNEERFYEYVSKYPIDTPINEIIKLPIF